MTETSLHADLHVDRDGPVAIVEIRRPPHNFFDIALTRALADAFEALDADPGIRASVLCSQGTAFCAGADFSGGPTVFDGVRDRPINPLYDEGTRIFSCAKPIVAAVQGAAVGGGLGLALAADFRVTCEEARFSANFARLGVHPGFGLSVTLPRLVGAQRASLLMMTGRRVAGAEAVAIGLADVLAPRDAVRAQALALAAELAASAPLAVESIRRTLRSGLVDEIRAMVRHETAEQARLAATEDFREGIAAMAARRAPVFRRR